MRRSLHLWIHVNENGKVLVFNDARNTEKIRQEQLYVDIDEYEDNIHSEKWKIPLSLRVIEPEAAIHIKPI